MKGEKPMKKWLVLLMCLCFALPVLGLSESIFDREWLDISFVHQREYTLPETEDLPYLYACTFGTLHIPAGVSDIPVLDYTFVEAYQVPDDHPLFKTVDGVLYSRDGKTLLVYPNARKASHFDVPFGVETIEKSAFAENDYLQSVSLPLTLKEIGWSSFYHCGGLISINIPLSVTEIGPYAFSDCVNLEKVSMSPALEEKVRAGVNTSVRYDDEPVPFAKVFDNCPKLESSLWYGDEGVTPAEAHYPESDKLVWLIASPKSVNEKVNLYAEADSSSEVLMQLNCGEAIGSTYEYHPDYYVVDNLSGPYPYSQKAYIKKSDVVIAPAETLFAFASIWPKNEDVPVTMTEWDENNNSHTTNKTYGEFLRSVEQGPFAEEAAYNDGQPITWDMVTTNQNTYYYSQSLPGTVSMSFHWDGWEVADCEYFLSDAVITREKTGDNKTLGLVVSDEPQNRVHLRSEANKESQSLGRYFTGTQLEIIGEEGDFYEVMVNGLTHGFMMKEYVRIVPQED